MDLIFVALLAYEQGDHIIWVFVFLGCCCLRYFMATFPFISRVVGKVYCFYSSGRWFTLVFFLKKNDVCSFFIHHVMALWSQSIESLLCFFGLGRVVSSAVSAVGGRLTCSPTWEALQLADCMRPKSKWFAGVCEIYWRLHRCWLLLYKKGHVLLTQKKIAHMTSMLG